MSTPVEALREQARMLWATAICFIAGTAIGTAVLWGAARPFTGEGSAIIPIAVVAGVIAAVAFVISTRMHRSGETAPMPRWQALVSDVSTVAVTVALAGVTALGTLLAGEVLATGLEGLTLPAFAGGIFTGVAAALGGRLSFRAGRRLSTRDIASLLFSFLVIGTLFAMITATDPQWWERSFSDLGIGARGWAFNGTVIVAGLLIATTGSYVGRDLHRMQGDSALRRITPVVLTWAGAGAALAGVGLLPLDRVPVAHSIAAFATLGLVVIAAVLTMRLLRQVLMLRILTWVLVGIIAVAVVVAMGARMLSIAALEGGVVALVLLWLTTLTQVMCALAPDASRPSTARSPLRA